jgi:Gram-negative bacterial TonB protein C-terminal
VTAKASQKRLKKYGRIESMFSTPPVSARVRFSTFFLIPLGLIFLASISHVTFASEKVANVNQPMDCERFTTDRLARRNCVRSPTVSPIKVPDAKYPKSRKHISADVIIEGVIAQNGHFIDAKVLGEADPDFAQSALDSVAGYHFKPATLNGKPVAELVRVVVKFWPK